jgi:hypothetical protein
MLHGFRSAKSRSKNRAPAPERRPRQTCLLGYKERENGNELRKSRKTTTKSDSGGNYWQSPPPVPVGTVNLFYYLGTCVGTSPPGDQSFPSSFTTWRNLLFDETTHASDAPLLDVSGVSYTGSDGKSVFRVTTFVGFEIDAQEPINVVATPRGGVPFFLTVEYVLKQADVEITVYAWDPNGNPAPGVAFDWRCRFVSLAD